MERANLLGELVEANNLLCADAVIVKNLTPRLTLCNFFLLDGVAVGINVEDEVLCLLPFVQSAARVVGRFR